MLHYFCIMRRQLYPLSSILSSAFQRCHSRGGGIVRCPRCNIVVKLETETACFRFISRRCYLYVRPHSISKNYSFFPYGAGSSATILKFCSCTKEYSTILCSRCSISALSVHNSHCVITVWTASSMPSGG